MTCKETLGRSDDIEICSSDLKSRCDVFHELRVPYTVSESLANYLCTHSVQGGLLDKDLDAAIEQISFRRD